jgi:hypothetical protein
LFSSSNFLVDYGQIIGGSVGGVLGLTLVTAVIVIIIAYCKCRKTRYERSKTWKGAVKYIRAQYGAAEKVYKLMTLYRSSEDIIGLAIASHVCMHHSIYKWRRNHL